MIAALIIFVLLIGSVYIYLRKVWFYRDPVRVVKAEENQVISPADGQVVYIKPVENGIVVSEKLGEKITIEEISKMTLAKSDGWIIGIYMSPLDVHYNYAPVSAQVEDMQYTSAKANLPMVDLWEYIKITYLRKAVDLFSKKYRLVNERNTVLFKGKVQIAVVEIADKFVSKITPLIKVGEEVEAGQKIGFIDRGSQVDLIIFDENVNFKVKVGQQVYGAKTVIAEFRR